MITDLPLIADAQCQRVNRQRRIAEEGEKSDKAEEIFFFVLHGRHQGVRKGLPGFRQSVQNNAILELPQLQAADFY
jgi:hypothetical protein